MYKFHTCNGFDAYETAEECAQRVIDEMSSEYYDEMLDEVYGTINICGYEYSASYALEKIDPIAYRCCMTDYADSCYEDVLYWMENMSDGDEQHFYGSLVEYIEEEEEE